MKMLSSLSSQLATRRGRAIAVGAVAAVLAAAAFVAWRSRQITAEAFVNAPVVTLRAPIPGRTQLAAGMQVGQRVRAEQALASIHAETENQRVSELRSLIAELSARRGALQAERDALATQITHRRREHASLGTRAASQSQAEVAGAEADLEVARAERERARTALRQAALETQRARELHAVGFISAAAYEKIVSDEERAQAGYESEGARERRARTILAAAHQGLQIDGPRGLPYVQTRAEELSESASDLGARQRQLEQQIAAIDTELDTLRQELAQQAASSLRSPVHGVVWSIDSNSGDAVARQGPVLQLVDCSAPWVEAFIDEKDATLFHPGDHVRVRAYHGEGEWDGEVQTVRYGTGRVTVGQYVVDPPPEVMRRQLPVRVSTARIRVAWTPDALAAPFCNVGRSVEIRRP
jgi:multidrug resistance efflux pump